MPETNRKLLFSILQQAGEDLRNKRRQAMALTWIKSESKDVGDFLWICDKLQINPNETKRLMVEMF